MHETKTCRLIFTAITLILFSASICLGQVIPLDKALAEKSVELTVRGLGGSTGDTILLDLRRRTPKTLRLTMPPGTVFRSTSGAVQNMVGSHIKGERVDDTRYRPASEIVLNDDRWHAYVVAAYCLDFHKPNPSPADTFILAEPDLDASEILTEGRERGLSINAIQSALWIHREGVSSGELKKRFQATDDDIQKARKLLSESLPKHTGSLSPSQREEQRAVSREGAARDWRTIAKRRPRLWDYRPPQMDKRQQEKLVSARTARIAVEQVYTTVNSYDPLGEMELPFENVAQRVLEYAGIRVLRDQDTAPADFALRIVVLGWASRTHKIDKETWAYMDADIKGTLSIEFPGLSSYVEAFESGVLASLMVTEYEGRQRTHPSDAPFLEAFQQFDYRGYLAAYTKIDKLPNSGFIPRLLTIVSFVYGIDPLIDMVAADDDVLQQHALKALERITGQGFGRDSAKWKKWRNKQGTSFELNRQQITSPDRQQLGDF